MVCTHCHTPNLSDYKFCRECGTRLPVPLVGEATGADGDHPEVAVHLRQVYAHVEQGRHTEAMAEAEAALGLQPDSALAHSAMGLVYERQGLLPEAIQELEKALRLNPGSTADREKLDLLRAMSGPGPLPPRRPSLLASAGVGVALLAVCGGAYMMWASGQGSRSAGPSPGGLTPARFPVSQLPAPRAAASSGFVGPVLQSPDRPSTPVVAPVTYPQAPAKPSKKSPNPLVAERIGLPSVIDRPQHRGLPAAAVGEIVPAPLGGPNGAVGAGTMAGAAGGPVAGQPTADGRLNETGSPGPAQGMRPAPARNPELIEPDSGFIKIEPVFRPNAGNGGGAVPAGAGPAPQGAQRPAPTISASFGSPVSASPLLEEARRAHRAADELARKGILAEAQKQYSVAVGFYQGLAGRGGVEQREAAAGLDACRRALAGLSGR